MPQWVMDELLARLQRELHEARAAESPVPRHRSLSREQYLIDIQDVGLSAMRGCRRTAR